MEYSGPKLTRTAHMVNYARDAMNIVDEKGNTWLHVACENGDDEMLLGFIHQCRDLNLNVANKNGETSLSLAISKGRQKTVEILVTAGSKVDQTEGTTPLHEAARAGHRIFIELLLRNGAKLEAKDKFEYTPLHTAALYKQGEAVQALLDAGANINARCVDGKPVHLAATRAEYLNSSPDPLNLLVKAGANPNEPNGKKLPPLIHFLNSISCMVSSKEYIDEPRVIEIVSGLLDKGADVNITDGDKNTPLHAACSIRKRGIIKLLLDRGADHKARNKRKDTPFFNFSLCANDKISLSEVVAITKVLLEAGAKIDYGTLKNYHTIIEDEEQYDKRDPDLKELKRIISKNSACIIS